MPRKKDTARKLADRIGDMLERRFWHPQVALQVSSRSRCDIARMVRVLKR